MPGPGSYVRNRVAAEGLTPRPCQKRTQRACQDGPDTRIRLSLRQPRKGGLPRGRLSGVRGLISARSAGLKPFDDALLTDALRAHAMAASADLNPGCRRIHSATTELA